MTVWKEPADLATTEALGPGPAFPASGKIDGVTLKAGHRVLVKDQLTSTDNGYYVAKGPPAALTLTATDDPIDAEDIIRVRQGDRNGHTAWAVIDATKRIFVRQDVKHYSLTSIAALKQLWQVLPDATATVAGYWQPGDRGGGDFRFLGVQDYARVANAKPFAAPISEVTDVDGLVTITALAHGLGNDGTITRAYIKGLKGLDDDAYYVKVESANKLTLPGYFTGVSFVAGARLQYVKKMREITRLDVEQFKKERKASFNGRGKLRAPASIDRELQLLSRIYSLAIERGLVETNPCRGVKLSAVGGNLVPRYLKLEEQQRLMPFLTGRRAHVADILIIDQYTGMRRTEILTLNMNQIDFLRDLIELRNTKSGNPRTVPVHPDIKPLLEGLCHKAGPSGYLFENPKTGRPLVDIKTAWRSALRDAGIPHIPFHCAGRHTFGTRAVDGGAPLSAVKDVMGHVDIRTTMRYVHGTDEGKRRAVEAAAIAVRIPSTNMAQDNELTTKSEM